MDAKKFVPAVQVRMAHNGISKKANEFGMLPMQERAYNMRGEQYLLIKSPPASGKSRALMFIALDKLYHQGIKKAIICVPERSIGGSFANQPLSQYGFFTDWVVEPRWNLCNASGSETSASKVKAVGEFLKSEDRILICTHATFRFAFDNEGVAAFDNCMIAIDEFHHVSADSENNRLGAQLRELIARDSAHLVAMTGSYFRGDSVPVLSPEDEERFASVTYTYYEQLNGYEYLKELDLGYYFYTNGYLDAIMDVLNPDEKTIVHIPNVNSRESTKRGKNTEVEDILTALGTWLGVDEKTGFQLVKRPDGRILKIADLVDDDPLKRNLVVSSLKNPEQTNNRDYVDIIIALGMAKEGFDWIWCEHALTVGYRSSLTEVVQIIGRATRDAPRKSKARFTNLIAQPDAADEQVHEAVNDTIKAIALSLLMEQVLAPRFNFTAKQKGPLEGFDYGEDGYSADKPNVGFNESSGQFHIELNGLIEPKSPEAKRIVAEDLNELIADFVADKTAIGQGLFNNDIIPEELTIGRMGKIVKDRYPNEDPEDQEAIRQAAIAAFNLVQQSKKHIAEQSGTQNDLPANTAFVDGVRKYVLDVRNLDIDLIDHINPFEEAYAILSKTMNEKTLKSISEIVAAKKINLTFEEAFALLKRAEKFWEERGYWPTKTAQDPWEKRMAEGIDWLKVNLKDAEGCDINSAKAILGKIFGVGWEEKERKPYNSEEERVIAGFEDIVRFFDEHGCVPRHGEQNDIFERLYAVRLNRLCEDEHWRKFLLPLDKHHLLHEPFSNTSTRATISEARAILAKLDVDAPSEDSIENLRFVRSSKERKISEEIASRKPVADFGEFKPLFDAVQRDLANSVRKTRPFQRDVEIRKGDFFILYGQLAYVAELGKPFITEYGRPDRRSRVIFSNETESDLLLRSLQRALYRDETSRRITEPEAGPLFSGEIEADDLASGTIYVLRSNSQFPLIKQNRNMIHKIGVTSGSVEKRIAGAKHDPTYLMDDVEIVATYALYNISRTKTEKLLHRVFHKAQFDAKIIDRFGEPIYPKEWFLVPLPIIDEVIEKIKDKSLPKYEYEPKEGRLKLIDEKG